MDLKELYSLRNNFTVIGLTGRTGSGCSKISKILCSDFSEISKGLRNEEEFTNNIFRSKYSICKTFLSSSDNWVPFELIKYKDVLLFFILNKYGGDIKNTRKLFEENFKEHKSDSADAKTKSLLKEIVEIDENNRDLINRITEIKNVSDIKNESDLINLEHLFFGEEYSDLKQRIYEALNKHGYFRARALFHWVSCNIRSTGDPLNSDEPNIKYIYTIAKLINRLIKAKRLVNGKSKPTKIVIDSLRNSLELLFFKERYSAFYMVATKDVLENSRERILKRLKKAGIEESEIEEVADRVIDLDNVEAKTKDFECGKFYPPDVDNCIQKSDYHIYNLKMEDLSGFISTYLKDDTNAFLTREEQLLKLISLIQQPGIITPSSEERAMQMAHTAELNSGCISRRVGAVITDQSFFIKSVGWNDVAKGQTPCNLRSFTDFWNQNVILDKCECYSDFEKGKVGKDSSYKYKKDSVNDFVKAIKDYLESSYTTNGKDLNGIPTPFCFKTIHNFYEGEANQVHTRSLHAEENAMIQITKNGGLGVDGGFLFTTASPCELCSKKAYQIGVKRIYFIDPYPGISKDQIIKCGDKNPVLIPFFGAIGNAYHKLYELFMSQKDEISMRLELDKGQNLSKKIRNVLNPRKHKETVDYLTESNLSDDEIISLLESAIIKRGNGVEDTKQ